MKLATWNLEGGGSRFRIAAQEHIVSDLAADVVVLTEPPAWYENGAGVVTSPQRRVGPRGAEAWVAIVGPSVEAVALEVPYERTAVAARASAGGVRVVVYGAVLPWLAIANHAPELVREGEDSLATFTRILAEQASDILELRRRCGEPVVWARPAQDEVLRELAADVCVLTEPPASYGTAAGVVTSPPRRVGPAGAEAWVAIVGPSVEAVALEVPDERTAVAARASAGGVSVVVSGTVLPWLAIANHAPELVRDGEDSLATFTRILAEQASDILELRRRYGEPVVWAGDFNQSLFGALHGGSHERRALLIETLASLGMTAWNGEAAHAASGLCSVDLICGRDARAVAAHGRIDPARSGVTMSDHAGYWVELIGSS